MGDEMTNFEKAKEIVKNGCKESEMFKFLDNTRKDIIEYIELFGHLGVEQNKIWNIYEDWQEA